METKKILVLFYSLTGATAKLAREVAIGTQEVDGVEVSVKRVPEIVSQEIIEKNEAAKAAQKEIENEFPVATIDDLVEADGVAFGTPVHFGSFASQIKQFIDQLSGVWLQRKMVNKPAAVFCTSGSAHGGEEVTLVSLMIPLLNLGMIPVGIPYPVQGEGSGFDAGSPYGAIYITGHKGKKELSKEDKKAARILGRRLATMAQILQCGCEHCASCKSLTEEEK